MKHKSYILLIICALMCMALLGCGKTQEAAPTEATLPPIDFEALLRQEAFPPESTLLEALGNAVVFSDLQDNGDSINFTLSAPDISADLLRWYDSRENITEEELEQKMLELLEGQKQNIQLQLSYFRTESGSVIFTYTEEYLSAASCGVRTFYTHLTDKVLTGGGSNG